MNDKKTFVMYSKWEQVFDLMTDEQAGRLIKAVLNYQNGGSGDLTDPTLFLTFAMLKQQFEEDARKYKDVCAKRAAAGALGGRPKNDEDEKANGFSEKQEKAKKANGFSEKQKKQKNPDNDLNEYGNDGGLNESESYEGVCECEAPKGEPEGAQARKHTHGQCGHVRLTELEYARLVDQFGEDGAKDRIEALDLYIDSKGKQYKNHYSTILCWERRDQKEQAARDKAKGKSYQQAQSDAWLDQIAEWAQEGDGTAGGVNDG